MTIALLPIASRPRMRRAGVSVRPSAPAARTIVAAMQPGWGLGNPYDAIGADQTAWGNPPVTRALFRKVRSEGFRSVRIPVTWEGRQGGAPDHSIDPDWLAKVRPAVVLAYGWLISAMAMPTVPGGTWATT